MSFFRFIQPKNNFCVSERMNIGIGLILFVLIFCSLLAFAFVLSGYLVFAYIFRRSDYGKSELMGKVPFLAGEVVLQDSTKTVIKHSFWQDAGLYLPFDAEVEKFEQINAPFTNKSNGYSLTLRDLSSGSRLNIALKMRGLRLSHRLFVRVGDRGLAGYAIGYMAADCDCTLESVAPSDEKVGKYD